MFGRIAVMTHMRILAIFTLQASVVLEQATWLSNGIVVDLYRALVAVIACVID